MFNNNITRIRLHIFLRSKNKLYFPRCYKKISHRSLFFKGHTGGAFGKAKKRNSSSPVKPTINPSTPKAKTTAFETTSGTTVLSSEKTPSSGPFQGESSGKSGNEQSLNVAEPPNELPEKEEYQIELRKDNQGLGITIAGYVCEKGRTKFFSEKGAWLVSWFFSWLKWWLLNDGLACSILALRTMISWQITSLASWFKRAAEKFSLSVRTTMCNFPYATLNKQRYLSNFDII